MHNKCSPRSRYYWPLTPAKCVTVWVAIDDVDAENGPMKFVPGSHVHGPIHHDNSAPEEQNVLSLTVPEAEQWGDGVEVISPLRAGQASLHSDMLLHSSDANSSSRRRCGVALTHLLREIFHTIFNNPSLFLGQFSDRFILRSRYHTPDVQMNVGGDKAPESFWGFVCRGSDPSGYWPEDVEPPSGEDIPQRQAARL